MQTELRYELDNDRVYVQWFGPAPGTYLCVTVINPDERYSISWYHGAEAKDVWRQHVEHTLNDFEA